MITGHTGFKGSWLSKLLCILGSDVYGYSLEPPTDPSLFELLNLSDSINSCKGDVRDFDSLFDYYGSVKPDVVFHLAAQPLVLEGYNNPRSTYETNVMGTVNILECARQFQTSSVLNVTTDKVYCNCESEHYYSENETLDGFDPYSNSKSCSELVTKTFIRSFPKQMGSISTARAGNVIGGGDFSSNRIMPDCVKYSMQGKTIVIRNPDSVRPYQHVLEPLYAYLVIASKQFNDKTYAGSYNVGPNKGGCLSTREVVKTFCDLWGNNANWVVHPSGGPHEAKLLMLDNTLLMQTFGIKPVWDCYTAIKKVVEWTKLWESGDDVSDVTTNQINEYLSLVE